MYVVCTNFSIFFLPWLCIALLGQTYRCHPKRAGFLLSVYFSALFTSRYSRSFLLILCSIHQRFYKISHFWTPTYSPIMKLCGGIICVFCDHNLVFTCSLKRALQMEIFNLCKYLGKLQSKFLQPRKGETNSRDPKDHTKR